VVETTTSSAASLAFEDLQFGQEARFEALITAADVDRFAELSGDVSPLHTDQAFAAARGFGDRVVHGAYLAALASRLCGMVLPGRNGLLLAMSLSFAAPTLVGTRVTVTGTVDQLSHSVRSAVLKLAIVEALQRTPLARGRLTVGFTGSRSHG
jgi:acyl dehydratase